MSKANVRFIRAAMRVRRSAAAVGMGGLALAGAAVFAATGAGASLYGEGAAQVWKPEMEFPNASGRLGVTSLGPTFDTSQHPFFKPIGENGRACVTCHQPADAMSLSLPTIQARWAAKGAKDPLFNMSDGANCPTAQRGARESHSLLLDRGLFRIAQPWPPKPRSYGEIKPQFTIEVVSDPTGCNLSKDYGLESGFVSVFRRPRMIGSLRYLEDPKFELNFKQMLPLERDGVTGRHAGLSQLADARTTSVEALTKDQLARHMGYQGDPSLETMRTLVSFMRSLYVAQRYSGGAGDLGEVGGPAALTTKPLIDGTPRIEGNDLDTGVFLKFDQWRPGGTHQGKAKDQAAFRASVARGYDIFNARPFFIRDTFGMNNIRLGNPIKQTCGFCHATQLMGHDTVPGWMDIGTLNLPKAQHDPALPLFKLTCTADRKQHPFLGRVVYTSDPGRALVSGQCEDIGGVVMQQFRGIAARAPYFTNGSAKDLEAIVDHYDRRYNLHFTAQDRADLVNFLSVL